MKNRPAYTLDIPNLPKSDSKQSFVLRQIRQITDTTVRITAYIGITLLILLMLVPDTTELGQGDQYFAFIIMGLNTIALFALSLHRQLFKPGFVDRALLCLTLYTSFNYFFITRVPAQTQYIEFLLLTGGILSVRIILSTYRSAVHLIFIGILTIGLIESVHGLSQLFGWSASNHRLFAVTGTFLNPGPYGGYLAVIASMAATYIICHHHEYKRFSAHHPSLRQSLTNRATVCYLYCFPALFLSLMALAASHSRAAWLAWSISMLILITTRNSTRDYLRRWRTQHPWKIYFQTLGIFILASLIGFTLYHLKPASANGRILMWNISARTIAQHPVFGSGFGSFGGAYGNTQAEYFTTHPNSIFADVADAPRHAFNEYLQTGIEIGSIGLILFLSLLYIALYRMISHRFPAGYGLLALGIFALFSYPFQLLPFRILLIFFIGMESVITVRKPARPRRGTTIGLWITLFFFATINTYSTKIYLAKIQATDRWKKERIQYDYGYYTDILDHYRQLSQLLNDNSIFLFEYGHALYKTEDHIASNRLLQSAIHLNNNPIFYDLIGNNHKALGNYPLAEQAYRRAHAIVPNRIYPLYLLVLLYKETGQETRMQQVGQEVLNFKEKIPSPAVREMKAQVQKLIDS